MQRRNGRLPASSAPSKGIELAEDATQPQVAATPAQAAQGPATDPLSSLARLLARQAAHECIADNRTESRFSPVGGARHIARVNKR